MTEQNQTFKKLIAQRGSLKAQLTKFCSFLESEVTNEKLFELKARKQKAERLWDEFQAIQIEIQLLDESLDQSEETDTFDTRFFEAMALADSKSEATIARSESIRASNGSLNNNTNIAGDSDNISIRLPEIKLDDFRGNYSNWVSFRESFISLIDSNRKLNAVQKFFYLKSVLKDEALNVISNLDITAVNYNIAWQLLVDRYENKKLIMHSHVQAIIDLKSPKEYHSSLRNFLDTFLLNYRALLALNEKVQYWDAILLHILNLKLDSNVKRDWESFVHNETEPTIEMFIRFVNNKCQLLQTIESRSSNNKEIRKPEYKLTTHVQTNESNYKSTKCTFCNGTHLIYFCERFLELAINVRQEKVKKRNLCLNCLKSGHIATNCKSGGCKRCHKKHNTLLHFEKRETPNSNINVNTTDEIPNREIIRTTLSSTSAEEFILLATAVVYIADAKGNWTRCRALLDNASQLNFITKKIATKLRLKCVSANTPVVTLNNTRNSISESTRCTFHSLYNNLNYTANYSIVQQITVDLPQIQVQREEFKIPAGINLADPDFNIPGPIDLLIGASMFWDLLQVGQIKLDNKTAPILQKTALGWLISGRIPCKKYKAATCNLNIKDYSLHKQLEKFWTIEEGSDKIDYRNDESEKHFIETYSRDETGRFCVALPFCKKPELLGESKQQAISRLLSLERKLKKDTQLALEYKKFLKEYEALGHMRQIKSEEEMKAAISYYLPHHCVVKKESVTTRYRVVFDASAKTTTNISLNEVLRVGPYIQDDLCSILIRFRAHNIVLVADISKMYRQIKLRDNDQRFQRIVWRENPLEEIKVYELATITYGTGPASFLATRCLHQLAIDNEKTHPVASAKIKHDFYMDDLLTGASNVSAVKELKCQLEAILGAAGLPLRKWISNEPTVLANTEKHNEPYYLISEDDQEKTLGVMWDSVNDYFKFIVEDKELKISHISKRNILSAIAKIFDPLGFVSPVIMKAKRLMQVLWQRQLTWDQAVPADIYTEWIHLYKQLHQLSNLHIPRQITSSRGKVAKYELHGFSDASEIGYGACVYLKGIQDTGVVTIQLVCSKSRVAPVKSITLPRLELCGALVLAKLMNNATKALKLVTPITQAYYWCDSMIVLHWISKPSSNWKTFVCNRVSEIQQVTDIDNWCHVPTANNPADLISRGCFPSDLKNNSLWWSGPSWLQKTSAEWPSQGVLPVEEIPDKRKTIMVNNVNINDKGVLDIFERTSSYRSLSRIVAWMYRFIKNSRGGYENRIKGDLSKNEMEQAIKKLSKCAQVSFSVEINRLSQGKPVDSKSKLLSLDPFIDEDGVLRVGGRLRNSLLEYDQKHPIILPKAHPFSQLIIRHEHRKNLHAGAQVILALIRQRFWIISGKQAVRSELRKCVICFKVNPVHHFNKMGDLPRSRVTPSRTFSHVGIDFAGPYLVKDGRLRNRKLVKTYFCVFVCMATKAIHLEPVCDLTTNGLLRTLQRFVSRRGLCSDIFSDNGTNFVGAEHKIRRITELTSANEFKNYLLENAIKWHFIPARSPHMGGIFEAAVRSAKHCLKRVACNIHFTYEEFHTLLCRVEAILNSRPLTPLSNDLEDLDVLTPGHFIIGSAMCALPQRTDYANVKNPVERYELLQKIISDFWCKWSKDYLNTLQQRNKWQVNSASNVSVGDLVMIKEDNIPPQCWPMGRIINLHPGSDGVVRVVTVKTAKGDFKRALNQVAILPVDSH